MVTMQQQLHGGRCEELQSAADVVDYSQPPYKRGQLLRAGTLTDFDRGAWNRDGFVVFPGALTEWATENFCQSLRRLQAIEDHTTLYTDWTGVDWPAYGLPHPPGPITRENLEQKTGGQERGRMLPGHRVNNREKFGVRRGAKSWPLFDKAPVAFPSGVPNKGVLPSMFPTAYDSFIKDVTTLAHPEFRSLQQLLLDCTVEDIRMDHIHMLNRRGPDNGRTWHGHPYDQDGFGVTTKYTGLGLVRTLCYPLGCGMVEGDGGLSLIKGAHLFRDPYCWNTQRPTASDAEMHTDWLAGRAHPITGEQLTVTKLSLPPGSLVCFGHHMPHYVGPIAAEFGTRLGLLMVYRRPDPKKRLSSADRNVPDDWVLREAVAGRLAPAEERLFSEY